MRELELEPERERELALGRELVLEEVEELVELGGMLPVMSVQLAVLEV